MSTRNSRKGAQDLLNEANLMFATKCSFDEAFPQIATIRIDYVEVGEGVNGWGTREGEDVGRVILTDKNQIGEYLRCRNRLCYGGGFAVGNLIRDMVYKKETEREGLETCGGYEGSPKGHKRYRDCMNYFKFKIAITYRG